MKPAYTRPLTWLVALIVPLVLILTVARLLFTPPSVQIVYRLPGFPEDRYGFTLEDRLHWSRVSLEYLFNDAGIDFLANQQLPDGTPLYSERELTHMVDVKVLFQQAMRVLGGLLVVMALLAVWAWLGKWMPAFMRGLGLGGRLTIGLVVFVLAAVAVSFTALFTSFHRIFFTGDSWLFLYSDTLIRLFPLPLWEAVFISVGVFTLLGAVLLIWLEKRYRNHFQ